MSEAKQKVDFTYAVERPIGQTNIPLVSLGGTGGVLRIRVVVFHRVTVLFSASILGMGENKNHQTKRLNNGIALQLSLEFSVTVCIDFRSVVILAFDYSQP